MEAAGVRRQPQPTGRRELGRGCWASLSGLARAGPRGLCQEMNREQMREDVLTQSEILGADPGESS